MLATRCECPFIFCESIQGDWVHSSRYWKRLRFTLMEFYEHSETCSDRRDHALEVSFSPTALLDSYFIYPVYSLVSRTGTVDCKTTIDGGNLSRNDLR